MRSRLAAALTLGLSGLAACVSPANMTAVEAAAQAFFAQEQQGQADQIYNDAAEGYRNATTIDQNRQLIRVAQLASKDCGAPARDPQTVNTTQSTSGYFVSVVYHRACPTGALDESFTFRFENGAPKLFGYHIGGPAFLGALAPPPPTPAPAPETSTTSAPTPPAATPPAPPK